MKSIIIKYSKYILTLLAVAAMAVGLLMPAQIKAAVITKIRKAA